MVAVIDTETNGREPVEVIELAYNKLDPEKDWAVVEFKSTRYCPLIGSSNGALAAHHILDSELLACPPAKEAKLPDGIGYVIAHNVDYDAKALMIPVSVRRICTLAMCRYLWPTLESHTLGAMCYALWEPSKAKEMLTIGTLHSAQFDTDLCTSILWKILMHFVEAGTPIRTAEELWLFSEKARVPTIIAFGKYKGTPIKQLPWDYKKWMLKQADMDPYVLKAVRDSL